MLTTVPSSLGKAEAFITFRRGRKKIYSNKFIYLNDQDEFEIELFNGLQEDTLVKITFSDQISNSLNQKGLLLHPGQRVFLDRFLDKPNKFKFDTYEVENSSAAKHAIAKNGGVKIEFFTRQVTMNLWVGSSQPYYYGNLDNNFYCHTGNVNNAGASFTTSTSDSTSYSTNNSTFTSSVNLDDNLKSIETGKIAEGDKSKQNLVDINDNSTWNYFATSTFDYQILPFSEKPEEIKNIKTYCSQCGTKLRSEWKFCSTCGSKC